MNYVPPGNPERDIRSRMKLEILNMGLTDFGARRQ